MLRIALTGSPWRDLLPNPATDMTHVRFARSRDAAPGIGPSLRRPESAIWTGMDSTIVRAHQYASAPRKARRRCGALTSTLHFAVETLGKPLRAILSAGEIAEIECAHDPIADMPGNEPGADKGYDANALGLSRLAVRKRSLRLAPTVLHPGKHERSAYRARNPVERFFKRVKHSRRIATRYGKLAGSHMAFMQINLPPA